MASRHRREGRESWASALMLAGAVAAPLLAGCAPEALTPAGARVAVAPAPAPGCALVAPLRGSAGYNGRSGEENATAVDVYLRNQAAARGADTLVFTSRQLGAGDEGDTLSRPRGASVSGGCPNCISVVAAAYRCPAAVTTAGGEALRGAHGAVPPAAAIAPGIKPPTAPTDDPPFAEKAAAAALAAASESARGCRSAGGPAGEATVRVTFATTGDVVYSEVDGPPFAGSAAGECVARKFRNARVPPFAGEARSLTATVRLGE